MPPEGAGEAREWLRRAESSLMLARQDKPESVDWADLCYLAQQAAEKAVKAVYRLVERPHRYTHNLEELGSGLEKAGLSIPDVVKEAVVLTRYAVETRYPTIGELVTEDEYREAVALAQGVVDWARGLLSHE